ncbi:MAG: SnoaL-like domain-containing protein [Eudoraea sp.]|nr:ester cyclase [Eudoraea sp.]NNJ41597.1 SnoaL-like domain-containing protein [Eudoraea sp.]
MKAWPILFLFLLCTVVSCRQETQNARNGQEAEISQKVGIWIDSCWNQQSFKVLEELTAPQFTRYMNGVKVAQGPTEMEAHLNLFFTAFPDLKISTDDIHYKDRMVFLLWNAKGTNTGVFGEVQPTGKKVNINGLSHLSFDKNGKISKEVLYYNELELLQQLGYTLIPPNLE